MKPNNNEKSSGLKAAILVGFLASVIVWLLTPYSNFVIGTSYISDSYLPIIGLFLTLLIVLIFNPLMRLRKSRLALDRGQMTVIVAILLMACVVASSGCLRMLPYAIARVPLWVRDNARLAEAFEKMHLPSALFPDKTEFGADTPVSDYFATELPPGESIPWKAWIPPSIAWGLFLVSVWMMMIGQAMVVYPQWRRNERLSFPLLTVNRELVADPEEGFLFAPLFRKKSFWIAAAIVFVLHLLAGIKVHNPNLVPAIPLNWALGNLFTEEPLRYLPRPIYTNRIYFIFLSLAFFMPSRIGFSVWFFYVAYAFYNVIGRAYFPPFYQQTVVEHRFGGMLALTAVVLWLGRSHWVYVFKTLFKGAKNDEERKDRNNLLMFLTGCLGMFLWMLWVGAQPIWALVFIAVLFMVSLTITRIVAETGIPFMRIDFGYQMGFLRLFPIGWISLTTMWVSYICVIFGVIASRVSVSVMAAHAIGLNENKPAKTRMRLGRLFVIVLVAGFFICGATHLMASYHHSSTLDGREQPISTWGSGLFGGASNAVQEVLEGRYSKRVYNQAGHIAFGAALAGGLQWACLVMPKWPLHPIGLLMVQTFYSNEAWFSVFLGWLIKVIVLRYGGARLYRAARPFFLGLIMGEVFAGAFWGLIPAILLLMNLPYKPVQIQPY